MKSLLKYEEVVAREVVEGDYCFKCFSVYCIKAPALGMWMADVDDDMDMDGANATCP